MIEYILGRLIYFFFFLCILAYLLVRNLFLLPSFRTLRWPEEQAVTYIGFLPTLQRVLS